MVFVRKPFNKKYNKSSLPSQSLN